jgi:hypothetical protein
VDETGGDKRKFERIQLDIPATVEVEGQVHTLQLTMRDISAGGIFFHATVHLEKGTAVKVEVFLPNNALKKITGSQPLIRAQGNVVRCESEGMAISLNGHEKTTHRKGWQDNLR